MIADSVLIELKEAAAVHKQNRRRQLHACVDPRLGPLVRHLGMQYPGLYTPLTLGGRIALYDDLRHDDGAAIIDWQAEDIDLLIHIGHGGCGFCAAARVASELAEGPLARLVNVRGIPEASDEGYAQLQLLSALSHPRAKARWTAEELRIIGFFVTADGDLKQYDWQSGEYLPYEPTA
jgi:hypothetical protein